MSSRPEIRIAAALITRPDGQTLLVRKRGTAAFMQPGGKLAPDEEPANALCRELEEELGLFVDPSSPRLLGRYVAPAANEPDHTVVADIFHLTITTSVQATAEIEECVWVSPGEAEVLNLAPLTRDHVLPLWAQSLP
jgi:8-oxo-dGTP diphosphatase